jgi:glycosyltransferase involved in cell wall biosynthesis
VRIVVDALQVAASFSGVGRQALALGAELRDLPEGVVLELRCTEEARPLLEPAYPPGTEVRTPLPRSRPRLRRIAYQQLVAPAREPASTLLVCLGDQAPLWGRAQRLLVVNDIRRLTQPATAGRLEGSFYRALVPRAARRADVVVTISDFSRDELRRVLGVEAKVVAQHPRPVADRPPSREGRGGLLSVGAARPYKGTATIHAALRLLADPPELILAGEGTPLGWLPDEELERIYERVLGTVNPSTYEGYGLPVAESLARGLPTIASDIPPHREIGGDAVLYFPPGDAAALAARIEELSGLFDELAAAALERSRQLAAAGPTWRELLLEAAGSGS